MPFGRREATFWTKCRSGLLRASPLIQLSRIETPGTGRGVPDSFMADPEYGGCFVELKVAVHNKINLSALQANWLVTHSKYGVRCRILALLSNGCVRVWDGSQAEHVRHCGAAVLGYWPDTTPPIDWGDVRAALFTDKV